MQSQMSSPMVSSLSCQDLDVDYTDSTLQSDEGGEMSPQDGMDVNPQPLAPEASTSSVAIVGGSGYGNPPIASKLHPIPAMGPTFTRMRFPSH